MLPFREAQTERFMHCLTALFRRPIEQCHVHRAFGREVSGGKGFEITHAPVHIFEAELRGIHAGEELGARGGRSLVTHGSAASP